MIRIVWALAVVTLALVAAGAQLDRQSRIDHSLAPLVPKPFRSFAQQVIVDGALTGKDPRLAFDEAVSLIRRRPVPAENLLALALAGQRADRDALAIDALQIAARRGWHSAQLQEMQLRIAMLAGNGTEAANRLAALWAVGGEGRDLSESTRMVLAEEAGRQGFARQMAHAQKWQDAFVSQGREMLTPEVFSQTIRLAARAGANFDCQSLANAARNLAGQGQFEPAAMLWSGKCARGDASGGRDAGFQPDTGLPEGPFDWRYPQHSTIFRDIRQTRQGWAMDYETRDPVLAGLATRVLRLTPGSHRLKIVSEGGEGSLMTVISCLDNAGKPVRLAMRRNEGVLAFDVPASDCSAQQLGIMADRGTREGLRVSLD